MSLVLPIEIIDQIFAWTDNQKLIIPFQQILSKQSLKQLLKNVEIDNECNKKHSNLKIIKILHSIGKECTTDAMDHASGNGHLDVVKYLHSIEKDCSTNAMDWASYYGHLDVVKYLHSVGGNGTRLV